MLKKSSKVASDLIVTSNSKFYDKIGSITYSNTNSIFAIDFLKFKKYLNNGILIDSDLKIKLQGLIIIIANE